MYLNPKSHESNLRMLNTIQVIFDFHLRIGPEDGKNPAC